MPQGWKSTSKIHQPISPSVRKQIDKREELLSQKSGRSNQQVMYLTSKTGWVKVSSAVNIQTGNPNEVVTVLVKPGQTEEFDGGSNKKAKANVLSGGLLNKKLKYRAGIFNTTNNSYNQENPGKGYRPVPGITGFQTQFAGTYGTLQKAVVQFQANSLDQLDLLESLYLRPGMSLLVEYGHSVYIDNQGKLQTNIKTVENFFELQGADGKETLQNRIKELRKESDHNYGGFFGTVQNYQWEINEDGTYTCSANIIAQGQLIESIGVIVYGPSKKKKEITPADIELDLAKNDFETFLVGILSGGQPTDIDHRKVSEETLEEIGKELPDLVNRFKKETEKNNRPLEVVTFTNVGDGEGNDIVKLIRMSNFLDLINVTLFMNAGNRSSSGPITKFYTGESDVTNNLTPYLTFFGHSSVNPTKCILGNLSKKSKFSVNFNYNGIERLASTDILDIFVSVEFIKNIFDDMVANETGKDQTILALVMRVLFGIKKSAGMINDFDIYIDEDTDIQYVVDRKLVPEGTPPTINLFGQKSTARAFNISSKITSDLTTMIAIGASATNTDSSIDAMQMKQWNQGMVDRFLGKKDFGGKTDDKFDENLNNQHNFITLTEYFGALNQTIGNKDFQKDGSKTIAYNPGDENSIASVHKSVMNKLYQHSLFKDGLVPAGIIPVQLSFTIDGIGGIKIGETFSVQDKILPERYKDPETGKSRVGFIVKGVNHALDGGSWITEVEALMYHSQKVGKRNDLIDLEDFIEDTLTEQLQDLTPTDKEFEFGSIAQNGDDKIRDDDEGSGLFGATRLGRKHTGLDLYAPAADAIFSPMDAEVTYHATPFNSANKKGGGYLVLNGTGDFEGVRIVIGYAHAGGKTGKKKNDTSELDPNLKPHQKDYGFYYEYIGEPVTVSKGDHIGVVNQIVSKDGFPIYNYCNEKVLTYKSDKMVNHLHVKAQYTDPETKEKAYIDLQKYYSGGIQSEVLKEDLTGRIK